jgi:uncharacterized protein YecT (DUF1311 family)
MLHKIIALLAFGASWQATPLIAQAGQSPSFDCSKAVSKVELLTCGDPALSAADAKMGKLYALAQVSAFGKGQSHQLAAQREWLKGRNGCLSLAKGEKPADADNAVRACLARDYHARNGELAIAILLSSPEIGLQSLRADFPKMASLYEALQLYLTKSPTEKWDDQANAPKRDQITSLLEPYFANMRNDPDKSYGNAVLVDTAASPTEAMTSDRKFASMMSIMSVYISNGDDEAFVAFPCAAIVKRPEMISAAGAYFGSTLDNFLMRPDCEQSLPAQPRLEALVKGLNNYWKDDDCDGGTIRFAIYRGYAQTVTSARIGLPTETIAPKKGQPGRPGLAPQLVRTAIAELADQYERYNGLSKKEALIRARYWVGNMVAEAGVCET